MQEYHNVSCGGCGGNILDVLSGIMSGKATNSSFTDLFKNIEPLEDDVEDDNFQMDDTDFFDGLGESDVGFNTINPLSKFDLKIGTEGGVFFSFVDSVPPFNRVYFNQFDELKGNPNYFKLHTGSVGAGMDADLSELWTIDEKDQIIQWFNDRGLINHNNLRFFLGLGSGTGGGFLRGIIEPLIDERDNPRIKDVKYPFVIGVLPYYNEMDGESYWKNAASTIMRVGSFGVPIVVYDNDEITTQCSIRNNTQSKKYQNFCESRIRSIIELHKENNSKNKSMYSNFEKEEFMGYMNSGTNQEDINERIANSCKLLYQECFTCDKRNDSKTPLDEKDLLRISTPSENYNFCTIAHHSENLGSNSILSSILNKKQIPNSKLLRKLTSKALLTGMSAFCDFRTASSFYWQAIVPKGHDFKYTDSIPSVEWMKDKIKEYGYKKISVPPQFSIIETDTPSIELFVLLSGVKIPKIDTILNNYMNKELKDIENNIDYKIQ